MCFTMDYALVATGVDVTRISDYSFNHTASRCDRGVVRGGNCSPLLLFRKGTKRPTTIPPRTNYLTPVCG